MSGTEHPEFGVSWPTCNRSAARSDSAKSTDLGRPCQASPRRRAGEAIKNVAVEIRVRSYKPASAATGPVGTITGSREAQGTTTVGNSVPLDETW